MDLKQCQVVDSLFSALQSSSIEDVSVLLEGQSLTREEVAATVMHTVETWREGQNLQALRMAMERMDLSEARSPSGFSVAGVAAKSGVADLLETVLEADSAAATRKDLTQRTLLHVCLDSDRADPAPAVSVLLKAGASASAGDAHGNTPLHLAARSGASESLLAMLATRCNVNIQNAEGDTPLHLAVRHKKNKCVEVLLMHGANSSQINFARKKPKDEAQGVTLAVFSKYEKPTMKPPSSRWPDKSTGSWPTGDFRAGRGAQEPVPSTLVRPVKPEYSAPAVVQKPREEPTPEDRRLPLEKQLENERKAKEAALETVSTLEQSLSRAQAELQSLKEKLSEQKAKSEVKFLFPRTLGRQENILPQLQQDLEQFASEVHAWQTQSQPIFHKAISRIRAEIQTRWADCELEEFGSYSNRLHLPKSDIDLVIVGPAPATCLQDLSQSIRQYPEVTSMSLVATAFIPVLKIEMRLDSLEVRIDITQQDPRHTGVKCSVLVRQQVDSIPRLREVNLAIKHLFQVCDFSEPFRGGVSSYAVFLMTLYFFQSHLPPLVEQYNLAEPLLHFLNFYAYIFDYQDPICVREAVYDPAYFPQAMEPYLVIVDPISPTRNVGHNTNLDGLLVLATQYILRLATKYLQREGACECQSQVFLNMLHETKSALNWN